MILPTSWLRYSEAQETREYLSAVLKGWWKLRHPIIASPKSRGWTSWSSLRRTVSPRNLLKNFAESTR